MRRKNTSVPSDGGRSGKLQGTAWLVERRMAEKVLAGGRKVGNYSGSRKEGSIIDKRGNEADERR